MDVRQEFVPEVEERIFVLLQMDHAGGLESVGELAFTSHRCSRIVGRQDFPCIT